MAKSISNRMITTPTPYTREHCLYVQEIGTLTSIESHISQREKLRSFLFFLVLSGRGLFYYNTTPYSIRQGDCVWIDCSLPYSHESSIDSPWELKWVHFYGKDVDSFYRAYLEQGHPVCFSAVNAGAFNEALSAMLSLHQEDTSLKEMLSHKYLTDIITLCFLEHTDARPEKNDTFSKITAIRAYLKAHFTEQITLDSLSSLFFISKYHLVREYKQLFHTTIINDLTALRLSHAKSLLRFTSQSITEIASACGYSEVNYFIKVFKKAEGITPLEYRRKW